MGDLLCFARNQINAFGQKDLFLGKKFGQKFICLENFVVGKHFSWKKCYSEKIVCRRNSYIGNSFLKQFRQLSYIIIHLHNVSSFGDVYYKGSGTELLDPDP